MSPILQRIVPSLLLIAGLLSPPSARSEVLENRNIGDWTLIAVRGKSGEGEICAVARYSQQRINLNIMASRANHALSFVLDGTDVGWQLNEGAVYDVSIDVDDHPSLTAKARADSASSILIPFATDFSQTEFLRKGRSLEVVAARGTFQFSLNGSAAALDALRDCAREHLGYTDAAASTDTFTAIEKYVGWGQNSSQRSPRSARNVLARSIDG